MRKTENKVKDCVVNFNQELYDEYLHGKLSYTDFCLQHNVSFYTMSAALEQLGLKSRQKILKETTEHNFFDNIDSEIKAYLLGFYVADGSIFNNRLVITVSEKDIEITKLFQEYISPYYTITVGKPILNKKTGYKSKPMAKISITSNNIKDTLTTYGIGNNKTYQMNFNLSVVPDNLLIHFIRGLFDGDGTVYSGIITKKVHTQNGVKEYFSQNCNWSIISHNEKLLINLSNKISSLYKIQCNIIPDKRGNYLLMINKISDFFQWREILYNDAKFYLSRKKEKYDNYKIFRKK